MRIALDGRSLSSEPAGISNFTLNAINALSEDKKNVIFIFSHKEINNTILKRLSFKNGNVFITVKPLFFLKDIGVLWFFLKFPFLIRFGNFDILWGPSQVLPPSFLTGKIKRMVTIHDLVFKSYVKTMSLYIRIENFLSTSRTIKNADFIWCVSDYTSKELKQFFPHRKAKDIFVGSGIDNSVFKKINLDDLDKKKIREKYHFNGTTMVFVGTLEPRKNLMFLLSLMSVLSEKGISLAVIGGKGWGSVEEVLHNDSKEQYGSNVQFLGYVSTDSLVEIYNVADIIISTSLNEGFGLPLLEAMACGCPVVAPHNSAMIDIVSGFGTSIVGWEKDEWVSGIIATIKNRDEMTKKLESKVSQYNWEKIGSDLDVYLNK
jgi:glycosyltransferase involved in cell wall biosynthesis